METRTPAPGTILLEDNFADAIAAKLPKASPDPSHYTLGYEGGEYVIAKSDPAWNLVPNVRLPGQYRDTSLIVDARVVGDAAGRFASIACRNQPSASGSSEYRFTVDPTQAKFALYKWSDGHPTALVDWRHSDAIRQGNQGNTMGLTCTGPSIAVTINGLDVGSAQDSTYITGALVLMGGAFSNVSGTAEVRFAKLVVSQAAASRSAVSVAQPTAPSRAAATAMPTTAHAAQTRPAWERQYPPDEPRCTNNPGDPWCQWLNARRRLLTDLDCTSHGLTVTHHAGDIVAVGRATLDNYGKAWTNIGAGWGECLVPSELVRLMDEQMGRRS